MHVLITTKPYWAKLVVYPWCGERCDTPTHPTLFSIYNTHREVFKEASDSVFYEKKYELKIPEFPLIITVFVHSSAIW